MAPSVDETAVYVYLPGEKLVSFDGETGKERWRFQAEGGFEVLDPTPLLFGERILFGSAEARLFYAVNSADGNLLWKVGTELGPDSIAAAHDNLVIILTKDSDSDRTVLLALSTQDGKQVWQSEQDEGSSSPSIFAGKVVFGGGDFFAYALDLKTGQEIWKSSVEGKFDPRNMPAIAFGDVFLADRIGNIYRLDGETGKRKWIFRDTEGTMDQSFPVIAGKTLFIGSSAGNLYALDTDSGRLLWQDHVNGIVLSGAADSERFYFGVKFGDEGLYAYEHDPEGELEPAPGTLRNLRALIGGVVLFALIFIGVVLYARRRRRGASESAS